MVTPTTSDKVEGTLLRPLLRTINEGSYRRILLKIGMGTNYDTETTKIEVSITIGGHLPTDATDERRGNSQK